MRKILLATGLLWIIAIALARADGNSGPSFTRGQIPGGNGAAAPAAGNIGQVINSTVTLCTTTTGLTSGVTATAASISLTPGTWTLSGQVGADGASGTAFQFIYGGIASSAGATGTPATPSYAGGFGYGTTGSSTASPPLLLVAVTVSSTSTYYANINVTFTVSTAGVCGSLTAVRIA
jgi:hypothetical protein